MIFLENHSKIPLVKKVSLFYQEPMFQRNNATSPYSAFSHLVAVFYNTQNTHSLRVISQNRDFYPREYLKAI